MSLILVLTILSFLVISLIQSAPLCGNGKCDIIESWKNCRKDCAIPPGTIYRTECGDDICEFPESRANCPTDCGLQTTVCGDGDCEMPETRTNCPIDCELTSWLIDYRREMVAAGIPNNYLASSKHYDYSTRNIKELIYEIRSNSGSAEEAVKRTAREVYLRVEYLGVRDPIYTEGVASDCTLTPASEILDRGYGLCSTQSKVNIAILRGMGIAARPMSGCASILNFCAPLVILPGDPLPKLGKEIIIEDGKGIMGGALHAWVEVWLPEEGWVLLESTNGVVYKNPKCTKYDILHANPSINNFCYSTNQVYISNCRDNSLFK